MRSKLVIALLAITLIAPMLGSRASAAATAHPRVQHCASHSLTRAADFQAVPNDRNASFGIGDVDSAVQLPDGRRLLTFGDTLYYNVASDGSSGGLQGFGNNSAWVVNGNCFTLLNREGPGNASRSWLLPPQQDGSLYWPGAAIVVGPRLYVFLTRLFLDRPFGRPVGSAVATFDVRTLPARITPIPFSAQHPFGSGGVYDGGYLYAYGSERHDCKFCFSSDLLVGRVPESQINDPGAWRFRRGSTWVTNVNAATPVLRAGVSNLDVFHYGNGFLLMTKPFAIVAPNVDVLWSASPVGPWQSFGTVFNVPLPPPSFVPGFTYQRSFTYGPTVIPGTRLGTGDNLAAYNVNTFDSNESQRDGRMYGPRFVPVHLPSPPAVPRRASVTPGPSAWAPTFGVDRNGRVRTANGGVGSNVVHTAHAVAVARTVTAKGGWVAASDGGVFAFGDARYYGSMGGTHLNRPIVGMAPTRTGKGYWLVASDGGIFSFGDARFYGSTGNIRLNRPILAMAATPTGKGYWFVASDGGIFSFGDAHFYGSTGGTPPRAPVSGMATTPNGRGYWLTTLGGQVYAFGDANFAGNAPAPLTAPIVGIVAAPGGYRLVDSTGNVFLRGPARGRLRIATSSRLVAAG